MKKIVFLLLALMVGINSSYAQKLTAKEKKEQKAEQVKELIESENFRFVAQSLTPMSGSKVNLTSLYYFQIEGDNVISELPYYGRAYSVEYGSTDLGVKFNEKPENIDIEFNENKKLYLISIVVKTQKERFQIYINAGLSGYTNVSINPSNRQSISYYGTIEPIPKMDE